MAQIAVGKLLPNLKVTLGNDAEETVDSDESDSQSSEDLKKDSESSKVEIVRSWMETLQNPKVYKNKSGGFTTGLDLISEDNTEILEKRAERFGLEDETPVLPQNIISLYESMGISLENRYSAKMKNIRLEALHLRGVNELNTSEVFSYFRDYGPASVEWINDFSCNVVWLDEVSCARALLGVSKPIDSTKIKPVKETSHEDSDTEAKDEESSSSTKVENEKQEESMDVDGEMSEKSSESLSLDIPVPPGHWRLGVPHTKAKTILLRFATKDDKKLPGAEKRSNYYKKYGNPNYGGLRGLISSSRKRKIQAAVSKQAVKQGSTTNKTTTRASSPDSDHGSDNDVPKVSEQKKQKPPRMRMYADDEELKTKKKWSSNSFQIQKENPKSVHSRLGTKYTQDDLCRLGTYHRGRERDRRSPDLDDYEVGTYHRRQERDRSADLDDYEVGISHRRRERDRRSPDLDDYESELADHILQDSKWPRKRNWNSGSEQVDLRTKLRRLRNNNLDELRSEDVKKHRSPLCVDVDVDSLTDD